MEKNYKVSKIYIHYKPSSKSDGLKTKVVHWEGRSKSANDESIYILDELEKYSDEIRDRYLEAIDKIPTLKLNKKSLFEHFKITNSFNLWWSTKVSEKCMFSQGYKEKVDCLKLLALDNYMSYKNIVDFKVKTSNKLLERALIQIANKHGLNHEIDSEKADYLRAQKIKIKNILCRSKSIFSLLKYLWTRRMLLGIGSSKWRSLKTDLIIFSYFTNPIKTSLARIYSNRFLGNLPEKLHINRISVGWLYLYDLGDHTLCPREASDFIRKANNCYKETHVVHVLIESFIDVRVLLKSIESWFSLKGLNCKEINLGDGESDLHLIWPYIKPELSFAAINTHALRMIINYFAIEEALGSDNNRSLGLYLYEGEVNEYLLLQAWSRKMANKIVAYPHSSIRYWDLRYHVSNYLLESNNMSHRPQADGICISGNLIRQSIRNSAMYYATKYDVETTRYEHLKYLSDDIIKSKEDNILIVADYDNNVTNRMVSIVLESLRLTNKKFIPKLLPHPGGNIQSYDLQIDIAPRDINLLKAFQKYSVIIISHSTTAVVEALISKVNLIVCLDSSMPNMCPLRQDDGINFICNAEQLAARLNNISTIQSKINIHKNNYQNFFTVSEGKEMWIKMVKNLTSTK